MSSDLRFTQAQRWDLLRMSGAALVSTIFFAVPMFVSRPDSAHLQEKPTSVSDKSARAGTQPAAPRDTEVSVVVSVGVVMSVGVVVEVSVEVVVGVVMSPSSNLERT